MVMPEKSQEEVQAEIRALEACKEYIPRRTMFGDDNHRKVELQIEYLRGDIDVTADDEWNEYSDDEQSSIMQAKDWEDGQLDESPSSGWDNYKPKPAKKAKRAKA
jgi:hypothetical protein